MKHTVLKRTLEWGNSISIFLKTFFYHNWPQFYKTSCKFLSFNDCHHLASSYVFKFHTSNCNLYCFLHWSEVNLFVIFHKMSSSTSFNYFQRVIFLPIIVLMLYFLPLNSYKYPLINILTYVLILILLCVHSTRINSVHKILFMCLEAFFLLLRVWVLF